MLLNAAGGPGDAILAALGFEVVFFCSSIDVDQVNNAALDPASGAVTNSLITSLSPASSVVEGGTDGAFDGTDTYTFGSTAGWSVGDQVWMGHASITNGVYEISQIVNGTQVKFSENPLFGAGIQSNISYQVGWRIPYATMQTELLSSGAGTINYAKFLAQDVGANEGSVEDSFYVMDQPVGSALIAIEGVNYTGQTVADVNLSLSVLGAYANNGAVTHLELAPHSTAAVNDASWNVGGTGEITLAQAENGMVISGGDGMKYFQILLKSKAGSAQPLAIDCSVNLDSSAPQMAVTLKAV